MKNIQIECKKITCWEVVYTHNCIYTVYINQNVLMMYTGLWVSLKNNTVYHLYKFQSETVHFYFSKFNIK